MYEDLLAHPQEGSSGAVRIEPDQPSQIEQDITTVRELEQQLLRANSMSSPGDSPFIAKLRKDSQLIPSFDVPVIDETVELHRRVIQLANARLDRLDVIQPSSSTAQAPLVPIVLFSVKEYQALTRACVSSLLPFLDN